MKQGLLLFGVAILTTFFWQCSKPGTDTPVPPALVANAGPDQTIKGGVDSTTLNGAGSGSNITSFTWTKVLGPDQYTIENPNSAKTVVKDLVQNKVYKFELRITDDMGRTAKDTVTINVNVEPNQPPKANAGRDTTISIPPNTYLLDGTGSTDPEGAIANYRWSVISGPVPTNNVIDSPGSAKTLIKNLKAGVYTFSLLVNDSAGGTSLDTVVITVTSLPDANAGVDIHVFFPDNGNLDGSQSSSNNIATTYTWTAISGPNGPEIANANAQQTTVSNLVVGTYQFELLVKDNTGLSSRDTMTMTVHPTRPTIAFQMIPVKTLGSSSNINYSAWAGNKILFAGQGDHVDIYDYLNKTWSEATLSQPRYGGMAVAGLNSKAYFAGGNISAVDYSPTSAVDIYDANTNTWTTASLSQARGDLAAATTDSYVYFGGGYNPYAASYSTVDVYDWLHNSWSTDNLTDAKFGLTGVSNQTSIFAGSHGVLAIFAGGFFSKTVDIYASTASHQVDSLSLARGNLSSAELNGTYYFAGGETGTSLTNVVDIYNSDTRTWRVDYLSRPKSGFQSASMGTKICFFANAGTRVDIYDISNSTWYTAEISQPLYGATLLNVDGDVYAAAGNMVWKLVF